MNILRIILTVLAIVLLIVSLSSLNPDYIQFAILPLVCFFFGYIVACHAELDDSISTELTAAPRLLAIRAPPLS
jgi:hypothetical protein